MHFTGTANDDDLTGTSGNDDFDVTQGGVDIVRGRGGNDSFNFGGTYTFGDTVRGGAGPDALVLAGDYSGGATLSSNIDSIEQITLAGNFHYVLTVFDGALDPGDHMVVAADLLVFGGGMSFDAFGETAGSYTVIGSAADDSISTGAGDDRIEGRDGADTIVLKTGADKVDGGAASDIVHIFGPGSFAAGDRINGGDGQDTVRIQGDYSGGLAITHDMMKNVEMMVLGVSFDYTLDLADLNASDDNAFSVDGSALTSNDVMTVDASQGFSMFGFTFIGGAAADVLIGSARNDFLRGGEGADELTSGEGGDAFAYQLVSDSTGPAFDTIVGFDTHFDIISPEFRSGVTVDAVDPAVKHGALSMATFDDDLEQAIGAAELDGGNAVLFRPKHGTLAGQVFVIVDGNGSAGYQAGEDLVIRLEDALHLRDLFTGNFSVPG